MLRENIPVELAAYISRMDENEQNSLLRQLKMRDAFFQARVLDKKQKTFNNSTKRLREDEIALIVRSIRKKNARSKT